MLPTWIIEFVSAPSWPFNGSFVLVLVWNCFNLKARMLITNTTTSTASSTPATFNSAGGAVTDRVQHSREEDLAAIALEHEYEISFLSRFTLDQATTRLRRVWRGYNIRVDYLLLLAATTKIQRNYRAFGETRRNHITINILGTR